MIKKNIPNALTSLNLICGCLACFMAFNNLFQAAFFLVLLGGFFDLFDGMFARILKVESAFGVQYDSMADLITSGVVPGVIMYQLFLISGFREVSFSFSIFQNEFLFSLVPIALISFLIPMGAAIRLAKFNLDAEQKFDFKGLPAPANALFIVSLPLLVNDPNFGFINPYLFSLVGLCATCVFSLLIMNINFRLFSFKIYRLSMTEYGYQFVFVVICLPLFFLFQWAAIPFLILTYLFMNIIRNVLNKAI